MRELMGRDMTPLDQVVFASCIVELYDREVKKPDTPSED